MAETSDVVIIGGGAAGCAVAYYLGQAGVRATIIEREGIGSQASGYSAGGLNPLQGEGMPGPLGALALESFRLNLDMWDSLKSESGVDFHPRMVTVVRLAFEESEVPGLKEALDIFDAADGFSACWMEPADLHHVEPRLSQDILRGLYTYGNAIVNSRLYTVALSKAAEKHGAAIRAGTVTGLKKSGGRVTGVTLNDGELECDAVVLAAGPWSSEAEKWLQVPIPVRPLKGEILRMEPPGSKIPVHDFTSGQASLFCRADGLIWVGATEESKGFDNQPSESARQTLLDGAIRMLPAMADGRIVKHTSCLRPVTPDWLPIVGKAPGWDNAYLATGAGKKGILMSTGMGKATADLMTNGSTKPSIGPLAPERFAKASTWPKRQKKG